MNITLKKILISLSLICSTVHYNADAMEVITVSSNKKLALKSLVFVGGSYVAWETGWYLYYQYQAGKISLENVINQFTHDSEIINAILKDHKACATESSINPY